MRRRATTEPKKGPSSLLITAVLAYPAPVAEEVEFYGVLQPGESGTWHRVTAPLALRSVCGSQILYGARLRAWDETPPADRCPLCLQHLDDR